jgi:Tol biopolymer transport system component
VPLSPGDRIGPYTVADKIGEGGMGEVFRGRDERLKRDVALKVLPASAIGDAERRRRFEREAQVLASLNHPSIAQVFGVELDGNEPIIVMEHVAGDTLADRLRKGPLPAEDALPVAMQICDGLEAAHERNIIHRDLKPANIKVRPDGSIKILDFGIARVLSTDTVVDTANSPTMLGGSTDAGIILGTAAYMSPEQARGRAVDKRADIWAFGCILFEMLTGTPVFVGESTTDILAEVVKKDPEWSALPAATPDRAIETLKRCLQKNPKDRARDIGDVRLDLEHALRAPASRASTAAAPVRSPFMPIAWFAAGAVVAGAAVFLGLPARESTATSTATAVRSTIVLPPQTTLALGRGSSVTVSPDGRAVAFTARADGKTLLYWRPLDRFESTPLAGTEGATNPFFSPDGRWIGFFAEEKLKKVSVDGGAPVLVSDALNPRGQAWGPDDTIFVTPSNYSGISRVPARGGKLEEHTSLRSGELSHRWPTALPNGTLLFSIWNDAGWEIARIAALQPSSPAPTPVVDIGGGYPRYVRDAGGRGYLVYARSEGLLAAGFDEQKTVLTTQAVPVIDGVITNLSGGAHFDLSATGTLAYVPGSFAESTRDLFWVGRDGKVLSEARSIRGLTRTFDVSSDGTRVIRNSGGDVWVDDLISTRTVRITSAPEQGNYNGIWSRDGKVIAFSRGLSSNVDIFLRQADGSGERQLTSAIGPKVPVGFSSDGRWLSYNVTDPVTLGDIWVIDVASGQSRPFIKTNAIESYGQFSQDGKWIVYQSNETGRFEVSAKSFPDGDRTIRISDNGGVVGSWSPTTNEILYRGLDNKIWVTSYRAGDTLSVDKPRPLFDATRYETGYELSADGQRLLVMPLLATELSSTQINIVQDFLSELRQRVK